jgi:hypothetical protein
MLRIFLHLFFDLLIFIVIVLARICDLIFENLDELVKRDSKDSAKSRSGPVNPVLDVEDAGDDARPKAASRVERAAGVVHTDQLCDE